MHTLCVYIYRHIYKYRIYSLSSDSILKSCYPCTPKICSIMSILKIKGYCHNFINENGLSPKKLEEYNLKTVQFTILSSLAL